MTEAVLDHSVEAALLDEMNTMTDRAARAQSTSHEEALLEAEIAASPALSTLDGASLCNLRVDMQCARALAVLRGDSGEPRLDRESYRAVVPNSYLARRFGDAPLVWWRTIDAPATAECNGVPPTHQVLAGEPMLARVDERRLYGVFDGFDWLGRPYIRARHRFFAEALAVEWHDAWFLRPRAWRVTQPTLDELRVPIVGTSALVTRPCDERAGAAISAAIARSAIGDLSVRHFIEAMTREGYFVCVRGSAVRDAVNGDAVKDVDIVTSAPPVEVLRIVAAAAPDYAFGDATSRLRLQRVGVVRVNAKTIGATGVGFDVTSMKRWDPASGDTINDETKDFVPPPRLGTSLEEDAWATDWHINTLYAYLDDAGRWMLADPNGYAYDDVTKRRLREPRCRYNPRSSARFWKFRMRGYDSDDATKQRMCVHFEEIARSLSLRRFAWMWNPIAGAALDSMEGIQAFMVKLGKVMHADGAGELFERYLNTETFIAQLRMTDGMRLMMEAPDVEETEELW